MLGASGCLQLKWMEPLGKQGFLPGRRNLSSQLPPSLPTIGSPLSPPQTPRSQVPSRLRDWSRAIMCRHSGWVFLAFNSSIASLWGSAAQWFRPLRPFSSFLPLHPPLHTSLILAKPRGGGGGGGGFWRGRRERQALQHPGAAIEWLSDGAYLSLSLFFFPPVGNFQDFIAAI